MDWDDIDGRGRHRRTFAGWELADLFFGGLLVANGDHLIVQAHARDALGERAPSQADTAADQQEPQGYLYGALRLIEHDGDGKVIAMESWPVQCGPLPEEDPSTLMGGNVTDRPFAGLTVVDDNCLAESADAVRSAATLSEVLRPLNRMRWVREGWR